MLTPQTCTALTKQIALLAQAARDFQGISLGAKSFNWPGAHSVARDFGKDADWAEHHTIKFIRDYGGALDTDLPQVRASSCAWNGNLDAYEKMLALHIAAQTGWREIAAATAQTDADANDFANKMLRDGVKTILQLTRWCKFQEQAANDLAAQRSFDDKRS